MGQSMLSLPWELLNKIVQLLDLEDFIPLWNISAQLRENLNPDSTFVKVGRLLLQFSEN